jgi:hypothetical protein
MDRQSIIGAIIGAVIWGLLAVGTRLFSGDAMTPSEIGYALAGLLAIVAMTGVMELYNRADKEKARRAIARGEDAEAAKAVAEKRAENAEQALAEECARKAEHEAMGAVRERKRLLSALFDTASRYGVEIVLGMGDTISRIEVYDYNKLKPKPGCEPLSAPSTKRAPPRNRKR